MPRNETELRPHANCTQQKVSDNCEPTFLRNLFFYKNEKSCNFFGILALENGCGIYLSPIELPVSLTFVMRKMKFQLMNISIKEQNHALIEAILR